MRLKALAILVLPASFLSTASLAQLAPGPNPITGTVIGPQTLSGGTGAVGSGGEIRIASGSQVALTMTGTSALVNDGTIQTLGTGRAIDSNSGIGSLTITNNGLISAVSSDAFRVNTNSAVSLFNSGTIRVTNGGQAIDWAAITSASNTLTNAATGVISAVGEDAVRPGVNGTVQNYGLISATPTVSGGTASGSDGIDLRTLSGIQVANFGTIVGRHGIATDGANAGPSTFGLLNQGTITAINGSGLNIDGVSRFVTATVDNRGVMQGGVLGTVTDGDGDGIDVDGILTLTNSGDVLGRGARGGTNNAEGVAAGGGSITNLATGRIIGSTTLADAPNGDASRAGNGILVDNSNGGDAVTATTVVNSGLIQGRSGFGIKLIGGFSDSITNESGGTIRGAGTGATIQMGGGQDQLLNRGAIVSDIGNAVDLEDGSDVLTIEGGNASIVGDIAGGAGFDIANFNMGAGNSFTLAGALSGFEEVNLNSGTLRIEGMNRIVAGTQLIMRDASIQLAGTTGPDAVTFAGMNLLSPVTIDLNHSSMTIGPNFSFGFEDSLTIVNWSAATSPDYAIRFMGDLGAGGFLAALLHTSSINGFAVEAYFDGTYTNLIGTMNPVPLPGALLLFGSGLGLLAARRRRHAQERREEQTS